MIKNIAVIYNLYVIDEKKIKKYMIIMIVLFVISLMHLGCQEKISKHTDSVSLNLLKKACFMDDGEKMIKYTRYFGCGTFTLILMMFIYNFGNDKFLL
jgi:hypothetical protein